MGSCGSSEPPARYSGGGTYSQPYAGTVVRAQPAAAPASRRSPLPQVGDKVRVKPWVEAPVTGWGDVSPGDVGIVRSVDGLVCKCVFAAQRGLWNGFIAEMEVLDDAGRPIQMQHAGMWRHGHTKKYCSTPAETEGPLCAHGSGLIKEDHWSCCGSTEFFSTCGTSTSLVDHSSPEYQALLLLAAAGAAALRDAQRPLISVGDTVRVKPWVTEPKFKWGNVTPGDVGTVREVDGLTCKVHFAKQPSLWTGFVPEMEVMDTSGSPQRGQHAGQWRAGRKHFCCSRPGQLEGPLCMHGDAIVREDHWSCCGQRDVYARCTA